MTGSAFIFCCTYSFYLTCHIDIKFRKNDLSKDGENYLLSVKKKYKRLSSVIYFAFDPNNDGIQRFTVTKNFIFSRMFRQIVLPIGGGRH